MAVKWDKSNIAVTKSDIAKATAVDGDVLLDFGASAERNSGDVSDVRHQCRIVLDREAAMNLLKLLNNLISRQNPDLTER